MYNEIIDRYEELNPHITIVREYANIGDYFNRLTTQAAGGNAPDVIGLHSQRYGREYTDRGIMHPLDEYVEKGIIDLDGWDQAIVDAGKVDGILYSIPKGVTTHSMIINRDMINRGGMETPPESGFTYEEFRDWAIELQANLPEGSYAVTNAGWNEQAFDTYVRNKGKSIITPDGSTLNFDKEDLEEWWNYWMELQDLGVTPPPDIMAEYDGQPWENSAFVKDIVAVEMDNSNQAKIFQDYQDDKVEIVRLPMPTANGATSRNRSDLSLETFFLQIVQDNIIV